MCICRRNLSLIKGFIKKIPSFRHRKWLYVIDNSPVFYRNKRFKKNVNFIKRKKRFYKNKSTVISRCIIRLNYIVTKQFIYQIKPYKKYTVCQTLSNTTLYIPGIQYLTAGRVLFNVKWIMEKKASFFYKGFIAYLMNIPVLTIFCNITNNNNTKITYAKSGGTYCLLRKVKKTKKKLLNVVLPSKQIVLFNKMTKVYIGKNSNFKIPSLVEGKWGFSFHTQKKIKVRGVAMNPVDHPNGGRTKSVQPERSPWSWVAKKKK